MRRELVRLALSRRDARDVSSCPRGDTLADTLPDSGWINKKPYPVSYLILFGKFGRRRGVTTRLLLPTFGCRQLDRASSRNPHRPACRWVRFLSRDQREHCWVSAG